MWARWNCSGCGGAALAAAMVPAAARASPASSIEPGKRKMRWGEWWKTAVACGWSAAGIKGGRGAPIRARAGAAACAAGNGGSGGAGQRRASGSDGAVSMRGCALQCLRACASWRVVALRLLRGYHGGKDVNAAAAMAQRSERQRGSRGAGGAWALEHGLACVRALSRSACPRGGMASTAGRQQLGQRRRTTARQSGCGSAGEAGRLSGGRDSHAPSCGAAVPCCAAGVRSKWLEAR